MGEKAIPLKGLFNNRTSAYNDFWIRMNEWRAPHGSSANDIDALYFDCKDPLTCVLEKEWRISEFSHKRFNADSDPSSFEMEV